MSVPNRPADLSFHITGMMCQQNCAATVQRAISTVRGVERVEVSFPNEEALVWGVDIIPAEVVVEVEDMGYEAVLKSNGGSESDNSAAADVTLALKGMFDAEKCPQKVSELVSAVDGVFNVKIDFGKKLCHIWGFADVQTIINVLATEGYGARNTNASPRASTKTSNLADRSGKHKLLFNLDKLLRVDNLKAIEASLKHITDVTAVLVDVEGRTIAVLYSIESAKDKILEAALLLKFSEALIVSSTSNTTATKHEYLFDVSGMSCANCAMRIEKAIFSLAEFDQPAAEISVSSMTNKAKVIVHDLTSEVGPRTISEKITSMGYGCVLSAVDGVSVHGKGDIAESVDSSELAEWTLPLGVSILLGVPVMVLHLAMTNSDHVMMMFDAPCACSGGVTYMQAVMLCLNLPILIIVGYRYYKGAVLGAVHGTFGMDCLVTTGTSITFIYSCVQLALACGSHIPTEHVFFETTGMLLMFVTIGKYIEAYAKKRSFAAISNLLKLQPREALLVVSDTDALEISSTGNLSIQQSTTPLKFRKSNTEFSGDRLVGGNSPLHTPCSTAPSSPTITGACGEVTKVISLDLVQRGDILKVFPGDRIPTDGVVYQGSSFVDEAMITGESVPVLKKKGDILFGSTVNQNNLLYVQVTSLGSESALAQIVKLVEAAQMQKAPVQAYADRVAGIFTPIILILAALTFTVWCSLSLTHIVPRTWYSEEHHDPYLFSMIFAISVVVISCPCALGLATPTAIMAGTSVGASNGILIKGGRAFETAHKVDTVVFDKTGTLTEGKPTVTDVIVMRVQRKGSLSPTHIMDDHNGDKQQQIQDEVLLLAATAEQGSDHPLSRAILDAARNKNMHLPPLKEDATVLHVGSGVRCETDVGVVLVGNRLLMEAQGIVVGPVIDGALWDLEIQGKTAMLVALDGSIRGLIGVADTAKPEAFSAVRALQAMGMDVWMVTGDNRTTAEALAEELDLPKDRVLAGVLPKDKVVKVQELQAAGMHVAMVGDGINDSPALAQADLGIAIGAGTEVAIEAADMVLIRSNLHDLVVALDLARVVFGRIKLNFMWAMIYNIMAVPYAAGIWFPWTHLVLPPQYAGLSMAASSVSVVASSMALWLYKRPNCLNEDSVVKRGSSGVLQSAKRGLTSLKNTISDQLSSIRGKNDTNNSGGIAMSRLKSNSSSSSLASAGSSHSAVYKQLASSENEAELGGQSSFVL